MNPLTGAVLVVDDDPDIRDILKDALTSLGARVTTANDGRECLDLVESVNPDVILLDIEMPMTNGLEALKELRCRKTAAAVVMITAYGSIERAVEAIKAGAYDFITKPFDLDQLALTVGQALEHERMKRGLQRLSEELGERYRLVVGTSPAMMVALDTARKAAASKSTVLLLGESGTGKEIFARAIHNWSERRDDPFVAISCVGLSRDLLESELFGHERGAFTGAHRLKKGKIELAQGGTVFLDEIGDMSVDLQTKLLRFLQEREFERVGGTQAISVDVRVIAATNRDLAELIRQGRFREDLYYRLNVIPITLPPLRDRREDIPALADYFLRRAAAEIKKPLFELSKDVETKLMDYPWPGNVRELANVIERAVVLGQGPELARAHLPVIPMQSSAGSCESLSYRQALEQAKRAVVLRALGQAGGNRAAAARILGLHKTHLLNLIKSLKIE